MTEERDEKVKGKAIRKMTSSREELSMDEGDS